MCRETSINIDHKIEFIIVSHNIRIAYTIPPFLTSLGLKNEVKCYKKRMSLIHILVGFSENMYKNVIRLKQY